MKPIDDSSGALWAHERLDEYLARGNHRRTPERRAVLDAVLSLKGAFTIERLQEALQPVMHGNLSQSTVYATLSLLVDAAILRRLHFDGLPVHYELVSRYPTTHLVCRVCGKVKSVLDKHLVAFMNTRRYASFVVDGDYTVTQYGTCNTCARRRKSSKVKG